RMSDVVGPYTVRQGLLEFCDKAIRVHETELQAVHGIKTKDQDAIFLPLGMKIHDFDRTLSQRLNSLGSHRGAIAHSFRIQEKRPKAAVQQVIRTLEKLLLPFDNEMCARVYTQFR